MRKDANAAKAAEDDDADESNSVYAAAYAEEHEDGWAVTTTRTMSTMITGSKTNLRLNQKIDRQGQWRWQHR